MAKEPTIDELLKLAHTFSQVTDERYKREVIKQFNWLKQQNDFLFEILKSIELRRELGKIIVKNALSMGLCPKCNIKLEEREIEGKKIPAFCPKCLKMWIGVNE